MARERVQTRCDPDTVAAIEEFAEHAEISQSEAVRRLLRSGIAAEAHVAGSVKYSHASYPGTDKSDARDLFAGDSDVITQRHLPDVIQVLLLLAILAVILL